MRDARIDRSAIAGLLFAAAGIFAVGILIGAVL